MRKLFSFTSNLQTYYYFELDFQNVDHHTGGKWLIHGTKHRKDNQLESLEPPVELPSTECLNTELNINRMAIHIPVIVTTIIMKQNAMLELVRGTQNDTQHYNNAHPKTAL